MNAITVHVGSSTVTFCVFSNLPNAASRIEAFAPQLRRMPALHASVIAPIFIVDTLAGGRPTGGGYYRPADVRLWLGRERRTGVSDVLVEKYALSGDTPTGLRGIIGITKTAFERPIYQFTMMHEIAHSVDYHLGIVPRGTTVDDFRGVLYSKPRVDEYAAQAYAGFIIQPHAICRKGSVPSDETRSQCNHRLIALLRRSPAFRFLPPDWMPGAQP